MVTISNLVIYNYPNNIAGDSTPIFSWSQTGSPTLYELQITYNINSFSSPTFSLTFTSSNLQYLLSPEFSLLFEGNYYAQLRGYDGSWGAYSPTLAFNVSLYPPAPPIINPVPSTAQGFSQTITGTKLPNLYVYVSVNGGELTEASYPNGVGNQYWSYSVPLVSGNNNITVSTSVVHSTIGAMSIDVPCFIYLATSTPQVYNVWNAFDEQGLLLSLQRNTGEKNLGYRARLIDVYQNPGNSTYQGLVNGISRELGVSHGDISVESLTNLLDPNYQGNLLNNDGNAIGTPLVDYAEEVYEHNPVFFGTVICDESYWDSVSQNTNGYIFLPHIWDATASGIYPKWQAGGIGDHDDLWVTGPTQVWNPLINDYNWYLQIHTGYFYSENPYGLFSGPSGITQASIFTSPSGFFYGEYYLYADKQWEMAPSGVSSWILASGCLQNAPVVVTASGLQETQPLDPFARCDGPGKFNKMGYGYFSLLSNGDVDTSQNQFAMHPDASGMIVFNNILSENVFIEYEGGPSSYYIFNEVDLNPMRNDFNSGFIAFAGSNTPVEIVASATNYTLTANGAQKTNILATIIDANGDPVPNQDIIFWIPGSYISYLEPINNGTVIENGLDGNPVQILNISNGKGQARVAYWPISGQTGQQIVYASWNVTNSPVFGFVVITQEYVVGEPFKLAPAASGSYASILNGPDYLT